MTKYKRIKVEWEYLFPIDMPDDKVVDEFDKLVVGSATGITSKNIEIIEK